MAVDYRLLLDGIIILLLVLTIVYAAILNRRLARLRGGRAELEAASRGFAEAALRLDSNLKGLRSTAEGAGGILQKRIDRASALSQQLGDLIDRAGSAAKSVKPAKRAGESARGSRARAPSVRRAPADDTPLVLQDVADETPKARKVANRQFTEQTTNGGAVAPGGDLADLLAALEELK